ncbi:MAG: hypothetical protein U0V02_13545 [Anaerolineales bacterium]
MTQWEYCEVEFDGRTTRVLVYDEAGDYIEDPTEHIRLGIAIAQLGHEGWELVSTWWRSSNQVTYMFKRPCQHEWTSRDSENALKRYKTNHPHDR